MADTKKSNPTPPQGASFVVGQADFTSDFAEQLTVEFSGRVPEDRIQSWPMVYILTNHDEAYVGQTTSLSRRIAQHGDNPEKQRFETVNAVYNPEFNASVALDYEHRLIDLIQGDGKFFLTNRNADQAPTNY